MNCNTGKLVLVTILVVLTLTLSMSAASAQTVIIADGSADSGATTTVTVTADDVTDLANFDITVTYDPAVVIVTAADNGDFGDMNNLENAAGGTVRLLSWNTGSGQTGDGVLLSTLTLEAVGTAAHTSALTLTVNSLMDSSEGDITATVDNGVFTVSGVPSGPIVTISDGSADSGATTTVTVTADDVTDLANFDITVTYDPAVVIVTAADNGDFGDMNNLENAAGGTVRLLSWNTGSGQTGDGVLLSTLTLEAVGTAAHTSALTLTVNSLMDSSEGDITATAINGVFTVSAAPTFDSITISPASCTLDIDDSKTFAAVCKTGSSVMTCPTLTWTSTDTAVGTITPAGVFTALAAGTTTITASAEGVTSNAATVTVESAVTITIAIKAADGGDLPDSILVDETFTVLITADGSPVGAGTNVAFRLPYDIGDPVTVSTDADGKVTYTPLITGTLGIRVLDDTGATVVNATVEVTTVTPPPPSGGGGGGGRGGTYPPGWGTTTTPAVTATAISTATPGVTPPEEAVTTPTEPAAEEEAIPEGAEETPTKKKGIPGFTAVFAIAGLLAVAYAMMRRRE